MSCFHFFAFFISIMCIYCQDPITDPIVATKKGDVRGSIKLANNSKTFYSFQGIPFAKPPIGPLRFKLPVEADSWPNILNATSDPKMCLQPSSGSSKGDEDCLYLSVYTPFLPSENNSKPLLSVQVFIHGGGFFEGDINYNSLNPEFYMTLDMVVVIMNYRLSVLGFLSTSDDASPGNYGMHDQVLALQWVRDNIAAFGGNKGDVTLGGQSAGSASVTFHILSPKSTGLFHRAFAESGSALCPWAVEENPLYYAQKLGKVFNCSNVNESSELVDCLSQQDAGLLISEGYNNIMVKYLKMCFVPVIDGNFLVENPQLSFQTGNFSKVPLMLGFNRDEGTLIFRYVPNFFTNIDDTFFEVIMPIVLTVLTDYRTNLRNVSYAIKDEYYADVDLSNQTAINIASINVISDMYMKSWIARTAKLISAHNTTTYLYAYNYVSNSSHSNYTGEPDVSHSDEMKYLFKTSYNMNEKDSNFGQRFFRLWANYIFYGNPTGNGVWKQEPFYDDSYYDINELFTMESQYDPEKMTFWWKTVPCIVYNTCVL